MRFTRMVPVLMLAAACGGEGREGNRPDTTPPAVCSSGSAWGGGEESPVMAPGQDCVGCHASGEGPDYVFAGTVMGASNDDDNCNGLAGVTVQIIGKDGAMIELTTNSAGNFFAGAGADKITLPFTAKVIGTNGKSSTMTTPQTSGACNVCHGATGANGAPGRITVPQ